MAELKYISYGNFSKFLTGISADYDVYVPVKNGDHRSYEKYNEGLENTIIGEVRAVEPLKSFFTRAREVVAEDFKSDVPHTSDKPFAIAGVKACDLKGFKIQDHVFLDKDLKDPFYAKLREGNLIISADCSCVLETCFCAAVDLEPYPTENFDINLSEITGGFIVETGSRKGEETVAKNSSLFQSADSKLVAERDAARKEVTEEVNDNVRSKDIPEQSSYDGIIKKNYESDIWNDEAKNCVECGACTIICPTCHCFLLYDQKDEKKMERLRVWDSCMFKNYARMAGGENPRSRLWMRLRNRFEKKFDFFPKVADVYACTGCGRCISACPAKIDIRKVLKRLVANDRKK
ncbi:MAG: 4Fe-4S dicluster domain-containing protein [Candidatus Omnitrophota bacterium]